MKIVTAPGVTYVVYAAAGATVTCPDRPDPLLTCAGGEPNYFTAPGAEVEISDDSAAIAACRNIKFEVSGGGGSGGSGGSGGGEWTDIRPLSNTWTGTNSFNGMVRFASGIDCMGAAYIRADLHKTINSNTLTSTSVLNMGEADGRYAPASHESDTTVHVTAADKARWDAGGGGSGSGDSQHVGLGFNSVSLGTGAVANNMESVAVGTGALIGAYWGANGQIVTTNSVTHTPSNSSAGAGSAEYSVSIGYHAATTADESVAIGFRAQAGPKSKVLNCTACVAIGSDANAQGDYSTALGHSTTAEGEYNTAVGYNAATYGKSCSALGSGSLANKDYSFSFGGTVDGLGSSLIGHGGYLADDGVFCANVGGTVGTDSDYSSGKSTQFYVIGAGTSLADTYTDGEAGLGFVVMDHLAGKIVARGCCKLSAICTDHTTDFSPKNVNNINAY